MPLLTQNTVDAANTADILTVAKVLLPDLKKSGTNWTCKSPFTDENTASFNIHPPKNIFKDFSSGKGGGPVQLVQLINNVPWREAVEQVCQMAGITIELEPETDNNGKPVDTNSEEYKQTLEKRKAQRSKTERLYKLAEEANNHFQKALAELSPDSAAAVYINNRFTPDQITTWGIGYAPNDWHWLTNIIRGAAKDGKANMDEAIEIGLLRSNDDGKVYDYFRHRVIFPLQDTSGRVVGFTGRVVDTADNPKYLNSPASSLYDKSRIIYGLYQAKLANTHKPEPVEGKDPLHQTIQKSQTIHIVEGQTDVITFHSIGLVNTVGLSGSALSLYQVRQIMYAADTLAVVLDGDKADIDKFLKKGGPLEALLRTGKQITVAQFPNVDTAKYPKGLDPDDAVKTLGADSAINLLEASTTEAIEYAATQWMKTSTLPIQKGNTLQRVVALLQQISPSAHGAYINQLYKLLETTKGDFKKALADNAQLEIKEDENNSGKEVDWRNNLPPNVLREDLENCVDNYGFCIVPFGHSNCGFHILQGSGYFKKVSNFIFKPLYFTRSQDVNGRIIHIQGNRGDQEYADIPTEAINSFTLFRNCTSKHGPFLFQGNQTDLDKVWARELHNFKEAYTLPKLGWHHAGFWAFYQHIYKDGQLIEANDAGVMEVDIKGKSEMFYSPAASKINRPKWENPDEDPFQMDKYMAYYKSEITFSQWADLFYKVYGDNAMIGVSMLLLTTFRDLVIPLDRNFLMMFSTGASQSGKSTFISSLTSVATKGMKAIQVNDSTNAAFAAHLSRFNNVSVGLNEFDQGTIDVKRFQIIKGAFDIESRQRQMGTDKKKTDVQVVSCGLLIAGQYLPTIDQGSVPNRSLVTNHEQKETRSKAEVENFTELQQQEDKGLSSIILELIDRRADVEKDLPEVWKITGRRIKDDIKAMDKPALERIVKNFASAHAVVKIIGRHIPLPFSDEEHYQYCLQNVIELSARLAASDSLTVFWTIFERMVAYGQVKQYADYEVYEDAINYKVTGEDGKVKTVELLASPDGENGTDTFPTILYLRIKNICIAYAETAKKSGQTPLNDDTIISQVKKQTGYLGIRTSHRLKKLNNPTSTFVFNATAMGLSLNIYKPDAPTIPDGDAEDKQDDLPF